MMSLISVLRVRTPSKGAGRTSNRSVIKICYIVFGSVKMKWFGVIVTI